MNASTEQTNNPYAPPTAEVSDAVDTTAVEHADRGTRLGAAIIDGVISILVVVPMIVSIGTDFWTNPEAGLGDVSFGSGFFVTAALAIALIGYTIHLVHKNGQTIGKKLLTIKVVRSDGSRASLARIFWLRNVVNALPGMIPVVGYIYNLVDHLWIFGEKRQCVHDKIADTIVVKA
jgi:uncharacterized RDD family membrane protein YckC